MPDIIPIRCQSCDVKVKIPPKYQGRGVKCPKCGGTIHVPVLVSNEAAGSRHDSEPGAMQRKSPATDDDVFANIDFADHQDFGPVQDLSATPARKRKPKPPEDDTPKPVRKKKKRTQAASYTGGGFSIDPSVIGGLVLMLFGGGIFIWLWNRGIIWPWAGVICIAGAIGIIKGLLGLDDD